LEQIILFLEILKILLINFFLKGTQFWEEKWKIFWNIQEYFIWEMGFSKLINYLTISAL
jgi:hypothetical protein